MTSPTPTPTTETTKPPASMWLWFRVPMALYDRLADVGRAAVIYIVLARHANADGEAWPSQETIGKAAGVSDRAVRGYLATLESVGLIRTIRRRRDTLVYTIPDLVKTGSTIPVKKHLNGSTVPVKDSKTGKKRHQDRKKTTIKTGSTVPTEVEPVNHTMKKTSSRQKLRFDEADLTTARWMVEKIRAILPEFKEPNLDAWANDFRLMRERDNRTDDEIRLVFEWANGDSFWQSNILCPAKLRKQFDALAIKSKNGQGNYGRAKISIGPGQRHPDDAQREGF